MPTVSSCNRHPDCVQLRAELPYVGGVLHLSRDEARALSHTLYYAATDDDFSLSECFDDNAGQAGNDARRAGG